MDTVLDAILPALATLLTLSHLSMMLLGVVVGLAVGILPGLGGVAGLSLLLPFAFDMEPSLALALMVGLLAPMHTSDTIPAILMGIPGTASAQATVMDGFPLARRGEAARALAAAFSSSLVGGLIGAFILTLAVFGAKPVILSIGFGELMMLTVFALSAVGVVTGSSSLKGLGACGLGLLIGSIGGAPATGEFRMTFDTLYLGDGIPLVIMGLGLFAMPEIVELLRRHETISDAGTLGHGWLTGLKDAIRHRWIIIRCSVIGVIIGAMPGLGGSVADWIVYGHVVQTSKNKEEFGHGDIRGVIAPESANNAITGGALIPTLLLGIPGSGSMAILLGGFILIGIQPGPSMLTTNLHLTFTIIWSLALANLLGAAACFALAKPVSRLTTIPYGLIGPVMIAIIFFGAFQATRSWEDLIALFLVGTVGVFMKRFGWSRPALLIGFVLSEGLEASFYRVAQVYGFSFLERPIVLVIIALTVLSVYAASRMKKADASAKDFLPTLRSRLPQVLFTLLLMAFAGLTLYDSFKLSELARIFPMWVALLTLGLIGSVAWFQVASSTPRTVFKDMNLSHPTFYGDTHFLLWIGGFLALVALFGMPLGAGLFILAFSSIKVGGPLWRNGLLAAGASGVLLLLAHVLNLYYPSPWLLLLFQLFA